MIYMINIGCKLRLGARTWPVHAGQGRGRAPSTGSGRGRASWTGPVRRGSGRGRAPSTGVRRVDGPRPRPRRSGRGRAPSTGVRGADGPRPRGSGARTGFLSTEVRGADVHGVRGADGPRSRVSEWGRVLSTGVEGVRARTASVHSVWCVNESRQRVIDNVYTLK